MMYKFDKTALVFHKVRHNIRTTITIFVGIGTLLLTGMYFKGVDIRDINSKVIVIMANESKFNEEKLIDQIQSMNFPYPYIVYAQAYHESNKFKSSLFIENNNLFGMKPSYQRINTTDGEQGGYAYYKNWSKSVYDYALYASRYLSGINTEEDYYSYLGQFYAEDHLYVSKIKGIVDSLKLKSKFE